MATKSVKGKTSSTSKPLTPRIKTAPPEPSEREFAAFGRKVWQMQAECDREEANRLARTELEAQERAAAEAAGITLKGARLTQAQHILAAINSGADAARELAVSAICTSEAGEQGAFLVGIENIALVICRKVDVLAKLIGEGGFGNFEDEFTAREAGECVAP
jgi:hypothetical protein